MFLSQQGKMPYCWLRTECSDRAVSQGSDVHCLLFVVAVTSLEEPESPRGPDDSPVCQGQLRARLRFESQLPGLRSRLPAEPVKGHGN